VSFYWLLIPALVLFFFLVFPFVEIVISLFFPLLSPPETKDRKTFGIIITAYRNWEISVPLVQSLLKQDYAGKFRVYLVADHCPPAKYPIEDDRLSVFWPKPTLNLKAKSIIYAAERFESEYDQIIVFDADNLAAPHFLHWINRYAQLGYKAVQGQRTAKNLDTFYARADAAGEFYKNYTDRELPFRLGASSVISGSGMSVEREVYLGYLQSREIQEGQHLWKKMLQEDKILQNYLVRQNFRIAYAPEAVLFDEKVSNGEAVETQRSRWLYSYFQNIPNALGLIRRSLGNGSFNQFWFGWVAIAPPLFIQILLAGLFAILGLIFYTPVFYLMLIGGIVFVGNIPLSLYLSDAPAAVRSVFWRLPVFAWRQFRSLGKIKDPNKNFKHTEHQKMVSLDDLE
jgi:cellulose synthase/poly-beta-1,6-N-acetylglucosamine synthase-like glycosyltransferase